MFSSCAENFFEHVLSLLIQSGHTDVIEPEFINHSAKQFVYIDCDKAVALSPKQRDTLRLFDNISRLFTVNGIIFFSLNLSVSRNERSPAAHEVHMLIQAVVDNQATVCISRHDEEIIFSFAHGSTCILSDWYSNKDTILEKLDIANMTIADGREYFLDFVSIFSRRYYFSDSAPTFYDLFPLNFFADLKSDITRAEIEEMLRAQKFFAVKEYGNDYVEYDAPSPTNAIDNEREFDLVLQEAENVQLSLFDAEDLSEQTEEDDYDLSALPPEIFADPERLLNYIEKISD